MRTFLPALVLSLAPSAAAQLAVPPSGGGQAPGLDGPADHLPAETRARIQADLDITLQRLETDGAFSDGAARRTRLPLLGWPIRGTTSDPGVHGVSKARWRGTDTSRPVPSRRWPSGSTSRLGTRSASSGRPARRPGLNLHFELHDAQDNIVEPHTGPCNVGTSGWLEQRPYRDSAINALLTHSSALGFATCPSTQESPNTSDAFQRGDNVITAAYYRDQVQGQRTSYEVRDPNGVAVREWTHDSPSTHNASYRYWTAPIAADAPEGTWTFSATSNGVTTTSTFTVGTVSVAAEPEAGAAFVAGSFAPHPARDATRFRLSVAEPQRVRVWVLDTLGRELVSALDDGLAAGAYLVQIEGETRAVNPAPSPRGSGGRPRLNVNN